MSVTLRKIAVCVAALAVAGLLAVFIVWLLAPGPPAPRSPFSAGIREGGAGGSGLSAALMALQSAFYTQMRQAVIALKEGGALLPLMGLGFAYGMFHAAGPGHGKAVIAAYVTARESALEQAVSFSFGAAMVQALVAILLVSIFALLLQASAASINTGSRFLEMAGFAGMAIIGLWLTWRKAGQILQQQQAYCSPDCGHVHLPAPETLEAAGWRERLGIVLAAGARPCAGALILLVFALSQGVYGSGIAAVFAMGLGVALTTSFIAALAVFAKSLALRLAGGGSMRNIRLVAGLELLAAALLAVLGLALSLGLATGSGIHGS